MVTLNLRDYSAGLPKECLQCYFHDTAYTANGKIRDCGDAGLQFRVRVRVRDKVKMSVGMGLVLGLAHFTFCHTSSPQNPASPHFMHNTDHEPRVKCGRQNV